MKRQEYFRLFETCIPVNGSSKSIIMDLQRESYIEIPNILFEILAVNRNKSVNELKNHYDNIYDEGIDSYITFLYEKELGFTTNTPNLFPPLNTSYSSPFEILTAVICVNDELIPELENILLQLEDLGCQSIQLRASLEKINPFFKSLSVLSKSRVKVVELLIDYKEELLIYLEDNEVLDPRFSISILHNNTKLNIKDNLNGKVNLIAQPFYYSPKEKISKEYFSLNILSYFESLKYNLGLNRKVCIDLDGSIKNYINHRKVYGNIADKKLQHVISTEEFKEKWNYNNDKIEICKDCQYRYMCLSNSDIDISVDKKLFKIEKCNYNPYKNEWNEN